MLPTRIFIIDKALASCLVNFANKAGTATAKSQDRGGRLLPFTIVIIVTKPNVHFSAAQAGPGFCDV